MREWTNELDDKMDFMEEEPTIRCGEGGCRGCDAAFHASCDPILVDSFEAPVQGRGVTVVDLLPYGATFDDPELDYGHDPDDYVDGPGGEA